MLHWLSWKFDLHEPLQCPREIPKSSKELENGVKPHHIEGTTKLCETLLVEHIQKAEATCRKQHFNPEEWSLSDFEVLEDRVRFELLHTKGVIERWRDGLVSSETLGSSMETLPLEREDYFQASCIQPHEFPPLVKKYGLAVLEHSLPKDDPLKAMITEKKNILREGLMALSEQEKLHPKVVKASYATTYSLARELYGRFEWAVKELSPVRLDMDEIQRQTYRLYIEEGKDVARDHLLAWKIQPQIAGRILSRMEKRINDFQGSNSNISSSQLEERFAEVMDSLDIGYRRQVPYTEFTKTDRRFRSDFLLEVVETAPEGSHRESTESRNRLLCIEITSIMDEHIHDGSYFERLGHKKKLVKDAGHLYMEFTELDDWRSFLEAIAPTTQKPDCVQHLIDDDRRENERLEQILQTLSLRDKSSQGTPNAHRQSSLRRLHFLDNPYAISAIRRRESR
jgi:hypothetical protein